MIDKSELLQRAENDLHTRRTLTKSTCEGFATLPAESRIAYARAIVFAGCDLADSGELAPNTETLESDRINAARLMLLKLYLDQCDPRWSSWLLDQMLNAVTETPGGTVGDLFYALFEVLGDYTCNLTKTVANFIQDVVVGSLTRTRKLSQSVDLTWLIQKTLENPTPPQGYLAFLALPPERLSPKCIVAILRSFEATSYWEKAFSVMREDLHNEEGRRLLKEWLAEGIEPSRAKDVKRALGESASDWGRA
jgi:hypothetical protein